MRTILLSLTAASTFLAACTSSSGPTSTDNPIAVAVSGDKVVVAADVATTETGFGCGGGNTVLGASVLFVSADGGKTFTRTVPSDTRSLIKIAAHDGVFYAVAHDNSGAFGVVTSADGLTWTEVATKSDYADDFAASTDELVVAHATGVMTSADGSTWTNHDFATSTAWYRPTIARTHGMIALGSSVDGTLHTSTDGIAWSDRAIAGLTGISQIIPTDDGLLVAGHTADATVLARIDLGSEAAPVVTPATYTSFGLLTAGGFLDNSGTLAPITTTGIGTGTAFVAPFVTGARDGSTVAIVRADSVAISHDGGVTFSANVALPLVAN